MNRDPDNGRTFASILAETRDDLKQFVETRISLLRAELREKVEVITQTAPLAILAGVGLLFGYAAAGWFTDR